MSSNVSGYVSVDLIGTIMAGLIAGGLYYANSGQVGTTGMVGIYRNKYGGNKSRKRIRFGRKTLRRR